MQQPKLTMGELYCIWRRAGGHAEVTRFILDYVCGSIKYGSTPLRLVVQKGHVEITTLFFLTRGRYNHEITRYCRTL